MEGSKVKIVSLDGVYEGLIYNSRTDKITLEKGIISELEICNTDVIFMYGVCRHVVKRR